MVSPSLIAGIGCRKGTSPETLSRALDQALATIGRTRADLAALASWTGKADEPGIRTLADSLSLPLHLLPSDRLAAQAVSRPSPVVNTLTGLPSVAEAAALAAADNGALLIRHVAGGVVVALVDTTIPPPLPPTTPPEVRP